MLAWCLPLSDPLAASLPSGLDRRPGACVLWLLPGSGWCDCGMAKARTYRGGRAEPSRTVAGWAPRLFPALGRTINDTTSTIPGAGDPFPSRGRDCGGLSPPRPAF